MAISPFSGILTPGGATVDPRYVYQEYSPGIIRGAFNHHIGTLHERRNGENRRSTIAQIASEIALLSLTGVGAMAVREGFNEYSRIGKLQAFEKHCQTVQKPSTESVHVKTPIQTRNHVNEYLIHEGIIWTKKIGTSAQQWEPVYFPGFPDTQPVEISADGSTLIAIDENRLLHHKEVLKEKWKHQQYFFQDTSCVDNWSTQWFSPTLLDPHGNTLSVPQNSLIALSERGRFNSYFEDATNERFTNLMKAVQLVVASASRREIFVYSLRFPKSAKATIPLPETKDSTFVLEDLSCSGSTIMIMGYEHSIRPCTNQGQRELKIYTLFFDLVLAGWCAHNQVAPTYTPQLYPRPYSHVLHKMAWKEHSLPATYNRISLPATVFQTGQGNQSREMRCVGSDQIGTPGFYYKLLNDNAWRFKLSSGVRPSILPRCFFPTEVEIPDTCTYQTRDARLQNFSLKMLEATLEINLQDRLISLTLRRIKEPIETTTSITCVYALIEPKSLNERWSLWESHQTSIVDHLEIRITINREKKTLRISPKSHYYSWPKYTLREVSLS